MQAVVDAQQSKNSTAARTLLKEQAAPLFVEWLAAINALIDREEAMNRVPAEQTRAIGDGSLSTMLLLVASSWLGASPQHLLPDGRGGSRHHGRRRR